MEMIRGLLCILISGLTLTINRSEALDCYSCSTAANEECEDPFSYGGDGVITISTIGNEQCRACTKHKYYLSGWTTTTHVVRSCSHLTLKEECEDGSQQNSPIQCACNAVNLCNSAHGLIVQLPAWLCLGLLAAIVKQVFM